VAQIRIIIIDADNLGNDVVSALKQYDSIEVIASVATREDALKLSDSADIVLMNPDILKGHTLGRFIKSLEMKSPSARILYILGKQPSDEEIIADIKTGIRGYVRVGDPMPSIIKAIKAVRDGEIWAERRILEKAIAQPMLLPETIKSHVPGMPILTHREKEVLTLVLQGASNREIADKSSISERTVKTHLYRVYKKLNVKSRTKAIALFSHA